MIETIKKLTAEAGLTLSRSTGYVAVSQQASTGIATRMLRAMVLVRQDKSQFTGNSTSLTELEAQLQQRLDQLGTTLDAVTVLTEAHRITDNPNLTELTIDFALTETVA